MRSGKNQVAEFMKEKKLLPFYVAGAFLIAVEAAAVNFVSAYSCIR